MNGLVREAEWSARGENRSPARAFRSTEAWIVAASLLPLALGFRMDDPEARVLCALVGLFTLVLAGVLGLARRGDLSQEGYEALRTEFPGEFGRLVRLIVRQDDAPTGADVGRLWSEGGRLFFAGRQTSFGLVPGQARGVGRVCGRVDRVRGSVELVLRRDDGIGPMALSLEPVVAPHKDPGTHRAALRRDLAVWITERAEGEGQFPPVALGPGVPEEGRLLRDALLLTVPVVGAVGALFECALPALASIASFATLCVMLGAVPVSNLRWRAWRARRRWR